MASSGIRIGAWDSLQWKHVTSIANDNGEIIAAKLLIYPGDSEEYYCFITTEAYTALKDWMDYRSNHGENITSDSWLMRDLWQTTEMNYGAKFGVATYPKKLKNSGIKSLLELKACVNLFQQESIGVNGKVHMDCVSTIRATQSR